jgi:predicted membrane protein
MKHRWKLRATTGALQVRMVSLEHAKQVTIGNNWQIRNVSSRAFEEETKMPVLILWAVPAVIFVGGVGYLLVRAVH